MRVEERRLQDAGREVDVVLERVVVGVDRGRRHASTRRSTGLPILRSCARLLERVGALGVAEGVAAHDLHARVVAPLVGIADLVGDGGQLVERLLLGGLASSRAGSWMSLSQRGLERGHHLGHARLALGAEGLLDVELAERLAELRGR